MLEEMLIRHGAPTLAGLKTGSLFRYTFSSMETLCEQIRDGNRRFLSKGLRVLPLKIEDGTALMYIYRPMRLQKDLSNAEASTLLSQRGYVVGMPSQYIVHLMKRLHEQTDFPHEIGLFLGYPPEDVRGFIENGSRKYKCVGQWKVYDNVEKAEMLFRQYKKCTDAYIRCYRTSRNLDKLAVSSQFVN